MLTVQAGVTVNAVVWIMSLKNDGERQSTDQVLAFLEPFLQAIKIPFLKFEPQSAAELLKVTRLLEVWARDGLRPIIHLDTHGDHTDGLYIAASKEDIPWRELADQLRPINVATQNNLCVVSGACFSMHTIMTLNFREPTPFFLMFAPAVEVTFGFIESRMFGFYEDVFTSHDVMRAYERHLAPNLQEFHCHRLVVKSISGFMRDNCIGRGKRRRLRKTLEQTLGPGKQYPDIPYFRKMTRRVALVLFRPNQPLIDRHAKPFLMGQALQIGFDEILAFVRADAMKINVLRRRRARGKRKVRRIRYAKRK